MNLKIAKLQGIAQARCLVCFFESKYPNVPPAERGPFLASKDHTCHGDLRDFQKALLAVKGETEAYFRTALDQRLADQRSKPTERELEAWTQAFNWVQEYDAGIMALTEVA